MAARTLEAIDFLREFNVAVHEQYPGVVTAAEESTAWPGVSRPTYDGGLGFTYKWNMGWMNDTLSYMQHEPIHRSHHQNELTFSLIYAFTENFMLPLSHDEVVHGKGALLSQMPGDMWQKFANLRLLYSYMWTHPGKKLLFMGGELGQWNEWNHDDGPQWELVGLRHSPRCPATGCRFEQVGDRESRPPPVGLLGRGIRVDRLHERGRQHAGLHSQGNGRSAADPGLLQS